MTILCLLANLIFSQTGLSLSPQLIELNMPAGAKRKFQFFIVNESKTNKLPLALYPADVIQDRSSAYKTVEIGKGAFSCAEWIELKDTLITLEPEDGKEITGYVKIPAGIKGGRYGAVVVETRLPQEALQYKTRIPVYLQIVITPPTKPKGVTVTDLKIELPKNLPRFKDTKVKNSLVTIATIKNEGDIHIKVRANLIIRDKNGRRIIEYPIGKEGTILPKSEVDGISLIKELPPGKYIADAIIRYGGSSPARASAPFEVTGKKVNAKGSLTATIPIALAIKPEFVNLAIFSNSVRTGIVMLENEEADELRVTTEIKDLLFDEAGEMIISDSSLAKWSSSKWVEIEPEQFTIKSYEKKPVSVKIKVPADGSIGGRYACVKLNIHKEAGDTTLPTSFYIPVYLTYTGQSKKGVEIEKIKLTGLLPPRVEALIKNIGNIHLKPAGKVSIYSEPKTKELSGTVFMASEQLITEFPFKQVNNYVLPDGELKLEGEAAGRIRLQKGDYKIKVEIDLGKGERIISETEIKI